VPQTSCEKINNTARIIAMALHFLVLYFPVLTFAISGGQFNYPKDGEDSKRRVTHEIWAKHTENGERQGKNAENVE